MKRIEFQRARIVAARVGLSQSQLWKMVRAGTFPAPVDLSERAKAFVVDEVDAWMRARIAERGAA